MSAPVIGEFFGTFILILLGNGVVAGVNLAKSKGQGGGWIVITAGWALGVLLGIVVSNALGGPGSLNPAGILADYVAGARPANLALQLMAAQFAGAALGAAFVWIHYLPHWRETTDPDAKRGCFCTAPAIRAPLCNFLSEFIGTFVLIFVAACASKVSPAFSTPYVAAVVWGIGLSLGGTTGYAINPARDLSPRLVHQLLPIAGKGDSDWGYAWVPVLGPFAGGAAAAWLFKALLV